MKPSRLLAAALLLALPLSAVQAQERGRPVLEQEIMINEAFLSSHPDLINRLRGFDELDRGSPLRAVNYFRRASRYADKTSQAMYAEMLWTGKGVDRDRAAAYAWMDLAAERGYPELLAVRESYWAALDEGERMRALEIGQQVYAEYGDDVAKPRMERVLQRGLGRMTGARTGSKGLLDRLRIYVPIGGAWLMLDPEQFYRDDYWKPQLYWTWKDLNVEGPRRGTATASDLYDTRSAPAKRTPRGK